MVRIFCLVVVSIFCSTISYACPGKPHHQHGPAPIGDIFTMQREKMVEEQIVKRGIKNEKVISALRKVPRHLLIPEEKWSVAYGDHPIPIGEGQTISQPYIVALMTELLDLKEGEKVLEIGTGSGYQAAVIAEVVKTDVYTIEIIPSLAKTAEKNLQRQGYHNIKIKTGDGFLGWKEHSPFDKIIITCSISQVPQPLIKQLKEGGKIVLPLGEEFSPQILTVVEKKKKGKLVYKDITGVIFVPMTGDEVKKIKKK